jgi:exodeoxyribonuclease VII large subunit
MTEVNSVSVSEYLELVNETLRMIPSQDFVVEGEVSDFRIAQQKWISFDLKDEENKSVLKCFMTVWQLKVPLEDGMRVHVQGQPKVYERFGSFKMNVQSVIPVGEGALRRAYELLKKKLEDEGLFDVSRKRGLVRFPEKIGLITSRDAAAYGDFVRILNNRWGGVSVIHTHVHVQGREAVNDIVQAFQYLNLLSESERPDVIVLTRGGGGLEDLHAFNDESVARALFQSKIPVVCGVGHERDESLCDFIADVRASTPSNAAELIVPNRQDVLYEIENMKSHMEDRVTDQISVSYNIIERAISLVGYILEREKDRLGVLRSNLIQKNGNWLSAIGENINFFTKVLRQLDPKRVLARGYGIITKGAHIVKNMSDLEIDAQVGVQLASGSFVAKVVSVKKKSQQKLI